MEIWTIMDYGTYGGGGMPVADGNLVFLNEYDNQIYSIGQGPTVMTVTASDIGVTTSTPVMIRGTVMDISAGTKQNEQAARFPNGVPAVSDASMSGWMEYVYMQKPKPTDITGVPVSIDVIDSNGNYRNIGTTTSDSSGSFSLQWAPDIPGSYTVTARFAGSQSYYGSSAETSFYATTPAATPTSTALPATSAADTYFVPAFVGLFVLIIIVAVVQTLLMFRKRP